MTCPHCQGAERFFNDVQAKRDLKAYHRSGPSKATEILLDALKSSGVEGLTLLDIGGGVGIIQHELMADGLASSIDVDASSAYLAAAQQEAERRGYSDRAEYQYGDFVDLATQVADADIVTLDRVLCCYPDVESLVTKSVARSRKLYGLIFPRDTWWAKLFIPVINLSFRLRNNPCRFYIHETSIVQQSVLQSGFKQRMFQYVGFWQVALYERVQ